MLVSTLAAPTKKEKKKIVDVIQSIGKNTIGPKDNKHKLKLGISKYTTAAIDRNNK